MVGSKAKKSIAMMSMIEIVGKSNTSQSAIESIARNKNTLSETVISFSPYFSEKRNIVIHPRASNRSIYEPSHHSLYSCIANPSKSITAKVNHV